MTQNVTLTGHKRSADFSLPPEKRLKTEVVQLSPLDEKLWRNFKEKALREGGIDPTTIPSLTLNLVSEPLQLEIFSAEAQGHRKYMEDAHFHCQLEKGALMGIFDGHGKRGIVAKNAALKFKNTLPNLLQTSPSDIKKIFKETCITFDTEVTKPGGGTTALVSYFDATTHRLYVSNLGDCKLKVFRKIQDQIHLIPVSITRDWGSAKDIKRAELAFNDPQKFHEWLQVTDPKSRYFPQPQHGVNVSRSLGDKSMTIEGKTAISCHPHVDFIQLLKDDLVVMGSDGLWDAVTDKDLIDKVISRHWGSSFLSQMIVDFALAQGSSDNVTVISALAKPPAPESPCNSTAPYEEEDT